MRYVFALLFFLFPINLLSEIEESLIVTESNWFFLPSIDEI